MEGDANDREAERLAHDLRFLADALEDERYTVQVMPDPPRWEVIEVETGNYARVFYIERADIDPDNEARLVPRTERAITRAEAEMVVGVVAALPADELQTAFHDGVLMPLEDHPALKSLAAKCRELLTKPEAV